MKLGKKDGIPVVTLAQLPDPPAPASTDQYSMFGRELDLDDTPIDLPAAPDQGRELDL